MGDGPVAVRTRSGLRQEYELSRKVSKKKLIEPSRRASKRKLATEASCPVSDAERKQGTDEDGANPGLSSAINVEAEPRGKLAADFCSFHLRSSDSDDSGLEQPGQFQGQILKKNGCVCETGCVSQTSLVHEMSRCLRRRVVVPTCDLSAEPPCGVAFQAQTVHMESRDSKAGWNPTISSPSVTESRVGANGAGCQLHESEASGNVVTATASIPERRVGANRAECHLKDVINVNGVTGKVYDSSSLERMCRSVTETATRGSWDPTDPSHLLAVKSALHLSAVPETILCRDSEQSKLMDFCKARVTEGRPGSMYICGCPGTGKSLTVEKIKSLCGTWSEECPDMFTVNCTSLTDPRRLYARFLQSLRPGRDASDSSPSHDLVLKQLKRILCDSAMPDTKLSRRKMVLLIVDEMDYLITRDQSVLYDLFRLTSYANSRLILLGIANAIDLTDRLLPKLRSMNFKVDVLTFPTYNEAQILAVLRQRLSVLPYTVFQPAALELCARRVAAAAGDMRKALHVCRSAIDVLEAEARAAAAMNAVDDSGCSRIAQTDTVKSQRDGSSVKGPQATSAGPNPIQDAAQQLPKLDELGGTIAVAQQDQEMRQQHREQNSAAATAFAEVRIDTMARALSRVFRSPIIETIRSLPRHQQLVLCAAVRQLRLSQNSLGRRNSNTKVNRASKTAASTNLADLHSVYLDFCRSSSMAPLAAPEFSSACQVLSDQALLVLGTSREHRLRKVGLKVDAEDVIFGMQGVRYLKLSLLQ